MEVVEIPAADTHPLRWSVLRRGTASDQVDFDGDDAATTFHLAVRDRGRIVAISSWIERRHPELGDRSSYQIRGMATDPSRRGEGLGAGLLAAGADRCAAAGIEVLWARARIGALGFYVRHGFEPHGPEYVDPTTGLPHVDVVRTVTPGVRPQV